MLSIAKLSHTKGVWRACFPVLCLGLLTLSISALAQSPDPASEPRPAASATPAPAAEPAPERHRPPRTLARPEDDGSDSAWPSLRPRKSAHPSVPFPAATPATPLDSYQEKVRAMVGKAWFAKIEHELAEHAALSGKLDAHFWVSPAGKITNVQIVTLTGSDHKLADATAAALTLLDLPVMSPELAEVLPKRGLEVNLKFDLY